MRHPLILRHGSALYRLVVTGEGQQFVVHSDEEGDVSFSIFPLGDGVLEIVAGERRRLVRYAVDGDSVHVQDAGRVFTFRQERHESAAAEQDGAHDDLRVPMPGQVTGIFVEVGQRVEAGQPLYALEAMKMESLVRAPEAGSVVEILCEVGAQVDGGAQVVVFQPEEPVVEEGQGA